MDPPSRDTYMNHTVQRVEVRPLPPAIVQDMTYSHTSPYRHSTESYIDQSDDPLHRWRQIEATSSSQYRKAIAITNNQGGEANTSNNRESFNYSSRSNSRDYSDTDDRPFTMSATRPPNSNRNDHPASVIVSPNYENDDDKIMTSSISSRLSFEPWESSVQPPPFVNESHMSENRYNYTSAPATTRRYNYSDNHEPLYSNNRNSPYEHYDYYTERAIPSQGYNDVSSHHQRLSIENDYTRRTSWNNGGGSIHDTAPIKRIASAAAAAVEPKMIEITPGNMSRLRDAQETITAIQNDFYVPCTCIFCNITSSSASCSPYGDSNNINPREPIFCIQDAEYFLCPHCASVNRLDVDNYSSPYGNNATSSSRNGAFQMLGGVGLGFTAKTLLEVQKDYISNHRN